LVFARQLHNFQQGIRGTHPQDFSGAQMALMAKLCLTIGQSMIFLRTFIRCDGWTADPGSAARREAIARGESDAEEGFLMAIVAIADRDHALHDPQTFIHEVHLESRSQSHRNPVRRLPPLRLVCARVGLADIQ